MEITSEILQKAFKIQDEFSTYMANSQGEKPNLSYEAHSKLFFFTKLAELELRLEIQDNQIHSLLNLIA